MINRKLLLGVAGFTIATFIVAIFLIVHFSSSSQDYKSAQFLPSAQQLPNFSLEKNSLTSSKQFSVADFNKRWSLVFFGFTECSDVCPLTLQQLAKLLQLAQQYDQTQIQVVFISLDPERDTSEKIENYVNAFNPAITGLRGNNAELAKLSHFFAADYYRRASSAGSPLTIPAGIDMPAGIANDYQVEHSGRIFIINPQTKYIGSFPPPHRGEILWSDLQMIIKR